jgi:hypothetical protein
MNELTILLTMLMAPTFLFLLWVEYIEFEDYVRESRLSVYAHAKSKRPVFHR